MKTIKEVEKEEISKIRSILSFIGEYAEFLDGRLDDPSLPIEEFKTELLPLVDKWQAILVCLEGKEL